MLWNQGIIAPLNICEKKHQTQDAVNVLTRMILCYRPYNIQIIIKIIIIVAQVA